MDPFNEVAEASKAQDEPWRSQAACREVPPVVFFAEDPELEQLALSVCASCSVKDMCQDYWMSLPADERKHGVWFGTTEKQRRRTERLRRKAKKEAVSA